MPRTPDSVAGPLIEGEALVLESQASDPPAEDDYGLARTFKIWRNGELIKQAPNASEIWILLDEKQHRAVRQLMHYLAGGGPGEEFASAYWEGEAVVFPTYGIWWETSDKIKKIVEETATWASGKMATNTVKVYKTDGTSVAAQAVDTATYSANFLWKISRVISVY